jgi:antitoxin VapB
MKETSAQKGATKVAAAKERQQTELEKAAPLWARLASTRRKIAAYPDTGLTADKPFFDEINGDA